MVREANPLLVSAAIFLTGCGPAPTSNSETAAVTPDPLSNLAQQARGCPDFFRQIDDHPEADARAAFASGDPHLVGYGFNGLTPSFAMPGVSAGPTIAKCRLSNANRRIDGGSEAGRTCPTFEAPALAYVERYNRETARLCAAAKGAPPIEHRRERD